MRKLTTRELAYENGYRDGWEMAEESGASATPVDGWGGLLINSIGLTATEALLGAREGSRRFNQRLQWYADGCHVGANDRVEADKVTK